MRGTVLGGSGRSLRAVAPLIFGFLLLLLAAALSAALFAERQRAGLWVRHTMQVSVTLTRFQLAMAEAETGQRGYLLTGRLSYLEPYNAARTEFGPLIDRLATETADNPIQAKAIGPLRQAVADKLAELQQTIDLRSAGDSEAALALVNSDHGRELMATVDQLAESMRAEENALLEARAKRAQWLERIGYPVLFGSIGLVLLIGALATIDARRRTIALEAAKENLRREEIERRAAETQVRQMQKLEAVGQLTGGVAHDFNNMLAIIIGSLNIARRRLPGGERPDIVKYLDSAISGAERAAKLTARLLAFSRQQALEPRVVDVNKLVGGMSEMLWRALGEKIQIETVLAAGLWRTMVDPAQLENAVVNLAVNARDAMPEGGKLIIETANSELDERYAAAHSEVAPGQYLMLSVTDTGAGMSREVMERAFDPFFTTKGVGKGTGLGLSQVYGFVKQSRGHLKLYSELGKGTTAKIYLPRYRGEGDLAGEAPKSPPTPPGSTDTLILVVEDEEEVRQMTVAALRELGYAVLAALTPDDALRLIDAHPDIALLFTDVVMPGMNGRELAARAVERRPTLKVLYTTGYTRNAVVHNGVVDPGAVFLAKPFTLEQLALKVRQTLAD